MEGLADHEPVLTPSCRDGPGRNRLVPGIRPALRGGPAQPGQTSVLAALGRLGRRERAGRRNPLQTRKVLSPEASAAGGGERRHAAAAGLRMEAGCGGVVLAGPDGPQIPLAGPANAGADREPQPAAKLTEGGAE